MSAETLPEPKPAPGEKLEKLAFQFCKIATVALILGRFTLAVAATLASILFLSAWLRGKKDTRCWARYPILLSVFWAVVAAICWTFILFPDTRDALFASVRTIIGLDRS